MISSVSTNTAYASSMMRGGMQKPPAPPDPQEMFSKTDANGDGTIDKVELSDALATLSESGDSENAPDADELFSLLDADGDGSITAEEHTQGMQKMAPQGGPEGGKGMMGPPPPPPGQEEEEEEDLFAATDTDGDGIIDSEELSSMLSSLSGSEDAQQTDSVEALFSILDGDGDGSITAEEHSEGLSSLKAAREEARNGKGGLSSAEISSALQNYQSASMDSARFTNGANLSTSV
jgi:Ca2+-binding EF-hand superfamily protein